MIIDIENFILQCGIFQNLLNIFSTSWHTTLWLCDVGKEFDSNLIEKLNNEKELITRCNCDLNPRIFAIDYYKICERTKNKKQKFLSIEMNPKTSILLKYKIKSTKNRRQFQMDRNNLWSVCNFKHSKFWNPCKLENSSKN